jgi:integrase
MRRLAGWLDDDELAQLLSHADTRSALAVLLMADAGCRLREALGFDVRSLSGHMLRIWSTKTSKWRSVPLTDRLAAAIDAANAGNPFDYNLWTQLQRQPLLPLNTRAMQRRLTELCQRAATSLTTPHRLRHSYASRLAAEGVPLHVISKLLGHANPSVTLLYIHGMENAYDQAAKALNRRASRRLHPRPKGGTNQGGKRAAPGRRS